MFILANAIADLNQKSPAEALLHTEGSGGASLAWVEMAEWNCAAASRALASMRPQAPMAPLQVLVLVYGNEHNNDAY